MRNSDLKIAGVDVVESTDGWTLRFVGNSPATWKLQYTEESNDATIHVEGLIGGARGVIWHADLAAISGWERNGAIQPFAEGDRNRIARNISRGMRALKHECKVQR